MLTMKVKTMFFDAPRVIRAMDRATRRALSKAGAFIRTRAKTSIRKRKSISKPGNPPHSHVGLLRSLLFFGYDPGAQSVVIGPQKARRGNVPSLLEYGGTAVRVRRHSSGKRGRKQRVTYRPRPFMGPAMEAELPNLPKQWRNSLGSSI